MTRDDVIRHLQLEAHIEGGFFRRTYTSPHNAPARDTGGIGADSPLRPLLSSIYYMLTADAPRGHLHRNRSDILHYWHLGGALRYWLVKPDGELLQVVLGPHLDQGQQLQLLVPGGWWKGTELLDGDFGLLSEAVSPGFDFADMELARSAEITAAFPQHRHILEPFCGQ